MIVQKHKIGWNFLGKYYKFNSCKFVVLFYFLDFIGHFLFLFKKRDFNKKSIKNILVIRLEHIGDVVLTTPFVYNLKKNFPKAKITLLCRSQTKPVAKLIEGIDKIITLNVPWNYRGENKINFLGFLKFLLRNFRKYDISFDLFFDPRNILIGRFLSKFLVGFGVRGFGFMLNKTPVWESKEKHIVSRQLDLLRVLNLKVVEKNIPLRLDKFYLAKFNKKLKKKGIKKGFTLIQMSAGVSSKEMSLKKWIKIINHELSKNNQVITADIDTNKITFIKKHIKNRNFIDLKINLKEYVYLVFLANKIISVDTFTVHLANNLNKKIDAYYSGTNLISEWGPYLNNNSKIFQNTDCKLFPCGLNECPYGYPSRCMRFNK